MSKDWLIDAADIAGFQGLSVLNLKHARLLRLSKLSNLAKEARQIKHLRREIQDDICRIDALIESNANVTQFPTPTEEKAPYERPAEKERRTTRKKTA